MSKTSDPDLTLFLDILHKLESLAAPYMVIGGFAATIYGITRTTYDIDIIVDLSEEHIQALAAMYPLPRYYADPHQMHNAARIGSMFNIIDTQRGEKADLAPLTMDSRYREAFQNRTRKTVELPNEEPFLIWCARSEDVIFGKLLAWHEGQSRRHPADIYEMMVTQYWAKEQMFDEAYVDERAAELGEEVSALWQTIKEAAREEVERSQE